MYNYRNKREVTLSCNFKAWRKEKEFTVFQEIPKKETIIPFFVAPGYCLPIFIFLRWDLVYKRKAQTSFSPAGIEQWGQQDGSQQ